MAKVGNIRFFVFASCKAARYDDLSKPPESKSPRPTEQDVFLFVCEFSQPTLPKPLPMKGGAIKTKPR